MQVSKIMFAPVTCKFNTLISTSCSLYLAKDFNLPSSTPAAVVLPSSVGDDKAGKVYKTHPKACIAICLHRRIIIMLVPHYSTWLGNCVIVSS